MILKPFSFVQIFHAIPLLSFSSDMRRAVGEKNRLKESSGQLGSKTRRFCPSEAKAARFQASLSSSKNHARSAFKRFFPPSSLRQTRISVARAKVAYFWNPLA
jgi:hypothetical protein